ncbi:hypothetical protein DFJ74DRAFT_17916 [Hyaloraphidium curvatum]|nr:hypothetical protein DFJ74DRAFT_17916 [Hyaloraphidium curvatum]
MLGKRARPTVLKSLPVNHVERLQKERAFQWGETAASEDSDDESRHTRSKGRAAPVNLTPYKSCFVDGKEYKCGEFALVADDRKESVLQIETMGETADGRCILRGQLLVDADDLRGDMLKTWLDKWGSLLKEKVGCEEQEMSELHSLEVMSSEREVLPRHRKDRRPACFGNCSTLHCARAWGVCGTFRGQEAAKRLFFPSAMSVEEQVEPSAGLHWFQAVSPGTDVENQEDGG